MPYRDLRELCICRVSWRYEILNEFYYYSVTTMIWKFCLRSVSQYFLLLQISRNLKGLSVKKMIYWFFCLSGILQTSLNLCLLQLYCYSFPTAIILWLVKVILKTQMLQDTYAPYKLHCEAQDAWWFCETVTI